MGDPFLGPLGRLGVFLPTLLQDLPLLAQGGTPLLHLLELLLVVLQLLGMGEHGVLRLPQLRGCVVQFVLGRCLLPLNLGQLLFGTRHLLLQGGHLAP